MFCGEFSLEIDCSVLTEHGRKCSAYGLRCVASGIQASSVEQRDLIGVGTEKNGLGKCGCKWN
jgi:hypothetical protein